MNFQAEDMVGRLVLDRYRIVRLLATGGMGAIFLARSEGAEGFVRPVVIKQILPTHVGDDEAVNSFAREARILSNLRHPGIVGVNDFARQDGTYFMAMEYVHGFNLAQWARYSNNYSRSRRFPAAPAVEIALQVLDALTYVHRATGIGGKPLNVVHRDIKPSNILISTEGHVKLADFGIARAYQEKTETASSGAFIKGTFPYVAPEIFNGAEPNPGTDVYSCAVVLYQVLAGHNPFAGKTPQAIIPRVLTHIPAPLDELRDDVSSELAEVIDFALGKSPEERYPDAASFALALRSSYGFNPAAAAEQLAYAAEKDFRNPRFAELLNVTDLSFLEAALATENVAELLDNASVSARMVAAPMETDTVAADELDPSASGSRRRASSRRMSTPLPGQSLRMRRARRRRRWLLLGLLIGIAVAVSVVLLVLRNKQPATKVVVVQSQSVTPDNPDGSTDLDAGTAVENGDTQPDGGSAAKKPKSRPKKPKSARELSLIFAKKDAQLQKCFAQHSDDMKGVSQISVRFRVNTKGRVESTEVLPATIAKKAAGKCIKKVAEAINFGYQGKPRTFRIPVSVRRK